MHDLIEPVLLGRSEYGAHFEYVFNRFVLQFLHRVVEAVNGMLHAWTVSLVFENGGGDISGGCAHFCFERFFAGVEARFDFFNLAVLIRTEIEFAMHYGIERGVPSRAAIGKEGEACVNAKGACCACDERSDEHGAPDRGHAGQSPRIVDSAIGA